MFGLWWETSVGLGDCWIFMKINQGDTLLHDRIKDRHNSNAYVCNRESFAFNMRLHDAHRHYYLFD